MRPPDGGTSTRRQGKERRLECQSGESWLIICGSLVLTSRKILQSRDGIHIDLTPHERAGTEARPFHEKASPVNGGLRGARRRR